MRTRSVVGHEPILDALDHVTDRFVAARKDAFRFQRTKERLDHSVVLRNMRTRSRLRDTMAAEVIEKAPRKIRRAAIGMEDEIISGVAVFDRFVERTDDESCAIALTDFVTDHLACEDIDDDAKIQFRPAVTFRKVSRYDIPDSH